MAKDTSFAVLNTTTNILAARFSADVPDPEDEKGKRTLSPEDQARAHLTRIDAVNPPDNKLELVEIKVLDTR